MPRTKSDQIEDLAPITEHAAVKGAQAALAKVQGEHRQALSKIQAAKQAIEEEESAAAAALAAGKPLDGSKLDQLQRALEHVEREARILKLAEKRAQERVDQAKHEARRDLEAKLRELGRGKVTALRLALERASEANGELERFIGDANQLLGMAQQAIPRTLIWNELRNTGPMSPLARWLERAKALQ